MTGKRALASLSIAFLIVLVASPVARAQDIPDTGAATDAANGATGTVEETANGATDTATGTVDETTDTVDDATGGATSGVTDTVDDAAGTAGNTAGETGGNVTNTVNNATGGGNGGGNGGGSVTDPVTDTVKDLTGGGSGGGSTSGVLDSVLGTSTGGGNGGLTHDLIDDLVDEAASFGLSPVAAEGWIEGKTVLGSEAYRDPAMVLASLAGLLEDFAADFATESSSLDTDVAFSTESSGPSLFAQAGRAAIAAAQTLAFPIALALIVVGFLAIQGRFGRKDPKLALAPVDTTEDSLIFE